MAAGLAALACSENESLVGKWVQAVPGMPRAEQGFVLEADGSAESVNMASMVYETWKEQDGFAEGYDRVLQVVDGSSLSKKDI